MKKIMTIASCLVLCIAISAQAQRTPNVNRHQAHQKARINQGIVAGEITHHEAQKLRFEQRNIRRFEHCAKTDGRVTPKERARLNRMQYHASKDIRRQKHDSQQRPKAY